MKIIHFRPERKEVYGCVCVHTQFWEHSVTLKVKHTCHTLLNQENSRIYGTGKYAIQCINFYYSFGSGSNSQPTPSHRIMLASLSSPLWILPETHQMNLDTHPSLPTTCSMVPWEILRNPVEQKSLKFEPLSLKFLKILGLVLTAFSHPPKQGDQVP